MVEPDSVASIVGAPDAEAAAAGMAARALILARDDAASFRSTHAKRVIRS